MHVSINAFINKIIATILFSEKRPFHVNVGGFFCCFIQEETCLIDGRCYEDGSSDVNDWCNVCDATASDDKWTLNPSKLELQMCRKSTVHVGN